MLCQKILAKNNTGNYNLELSSYASLSGSHSGHPLQQMLVFAHRISYIVHYFYR